MTLMTSEKESEGRMDQEQAFYELMELTDLGPRFHGSPGIAHAADWLEERLTDSGLAVRRSPVTLPGWDPSGGTSATVTQPWQQELVCWPMLGTQGTRGSVRGSVVHLGDQGLWGDSQLWQRLAVVDESRHPVAILHVRDKGPAAPQPLPSGSDQSVPHVSIAQDDGARIIDSVRRGEVVEIVVDCGSGAAPELTSDNLAVTVPGTGEGRALVCAHYDTFWNTPGAYDNGSGTIALLNLARLLVREPLRRTIDVVFFTAEEWHLGGSRHFVAKAAPDYLAELDFVLNIDGLGDGDLIELAGGPEPFEQKLYAAVVENVLRTRPGTAVRTRFPATKGTDDASFAARGVPTGFLTFNNWHKLHQPDDLPTPGIARNIAWCVPLAKELLSDLERPDRLSSVDFL